MKSWPVKSTATTIPKSLLLVIGLTLSTAEKSPVKLKTRMCLFMKSLYATAREIKRNKPA